MKPILLMLLLTSCGAGPQDEAPDSGEAVPDAGKVDEPPDAGAPDAGPRFFAAQIKYDITTGPSCAPPITVPPPTHCIVTDPKFPEVLRSSILTDYGDCALSNYESALVTIDCSGQCKQIGSAGCGLQSLTIWTCPTPRFAQAFACAWNGY